jgi:elongation factor G
MAYDAGNIKNIAFLGHGNSGKTTLAEAMLYNTGAITRQGTINDGTTTGDYDPDEIKKGITMSTSLLPVITKKNKINILDTPGFPDYQGEIYRSLKVVESVAVLIDAQAGVEVDTEFFWEIANSKNLPAIFFINKLDKENVNFENAVSSIKKLTEDAVAFHIPIGVSNTFEGFADIIKGKAYYYKKNDKGKAEIKDIPADLADAVQEAKEAIMEKVAESDESLLDTFFEEGTLTDEQLSTGIKSAIQKGLLFPVLCGSAELNIGTDRFIEAITEYLPSPADIKSIEAIEKTISPEDSETRAFIWKTSTEQHVGEVTFARIYSGNLKSGDSLKNSRTQNSEKIGQIALMRGKERTELDSIVAGDIAALLKLKDSTTNDTLSSDGISIKPIEFPLPLIQVAVKPKSKADQEKVSAALRKLSKDDPTFNLTIDAEMAQSIISGMGEAHLNTMVSRLKNRFSVDVETVKPRIPYREALKKGADTNYRHKKQSGGRGQFGEVFIEFKPLKESEESFEFINAIFGGSIPSKYVPAVEKGLRETMERGVIAGYPIINISARLYDGKYHDVDSSEMAFKIAASQAFKQGMEKGGYTFLEPIYNIEIKVPEENQGDVMGDLNTRRGKIMGMEASGKYQILKAQVPYAEMYKYINDLKSMTRGRGTFQMTFSHYEEVPQNLHQAIIEESKKISEDDE